MSWGEIGYALNSTVKNPSEFLPLDLLIPYNIAVQDGMVVREFETPGVYKVSVPVWATKLKIHAACGGGGGGAGGGKNYYHGGGGGAAAIMNQEYVLSGIEEITVVVGAGGIKGNDNKVVTYAGGDGGSTSIAEIGLTLKGGYGGTANTSSSKAYGGGAGGSGGGAGGKWGLNGEDSPFASGGLANDTAGGGASLGAGGNGVGISGDSGGSVTLPTKPGRGGGGGAGYYNSTDAAAGGNGYVKLEWLA